MRFECERDEFHKALQAVSGVVTSKGVHPVYESVEIIADENGLTCLATDLEIGMRVRLPASESVRITEPGTAVVPAQRLAAVCRELPGSEVKFSWDPEKRESTIESGSAHFQLLGQAPEDFPEIPDVGDAKGITIAASALHEMIRKVSFAAAKERMRFALNGVLLRVEGDTLEMVATDGRRLARDSVTCTNESGAEMEAIVPTKGLQQLDKVMGTGDDIVTLAVGNNHFGGRTETVTVVSRLVEGSFPSYRDVVPKDCQFRAVVERAAFQGALKRASLVTTRDAQSVTMRFHGEQLTITARSLEGSAQETLACDFGGDDQVIGFNPEFLLDVVPVLSGESLSFEWNGKSSPGKICEAAYTYVVMPVSLE